MFRYLPTRYNQQLSALGVIQIGTLHDFRRAEHARGVADPREGKKRVTHRVNLADTNDPNAAGNIHIRALSEFGVVPVSNSVRVIIRNTLLAKELHAPDCFILCASTMCSRLTMQEFDGADSCIEITRPAAFFEIATAALNVVTPVEFLGCSPVRYHEKFEEWNGVDWGSNPALLKEPKFSNQFEVRAVWRPLRTNPISPVKIADVRLTGLVRWRQV